MKFVTAKARAASHPIFGNVNSESKSSKPPHNRSRMRDWKWGGFSTHSKPQGGLTGKEKQRFIMCTSDHWLSCCEKFRKLSYEERRLFVRDKKLCGNCLYPGHFIGSCPRGSFCKVKVALPSIQLSSTLTMRRTIKSRQMKILFTMINKVLQRRKKLSKTTLLAKRTTPTLSPVILRQALLSLGLWVFQFGSRLKVRVRWWKHMHSSTLVQTPRFAPRAFWRSWLLNFTPVDCSLVSLEASDLSESNTVELLMVYSRPSLPIPPPPEAIARQEDLDRWPYLKGVNITHIDAEIGLQIGSDIPKALQPQEMRPTEDSGPFATWTVLGWVLNGPLGRRSKKSPTANFVQVDKSRDEQFQQFFNLEFNNSKSSVKGLNVTQRPKSSGNYERNCEDWRWTLRNGFTRKTYPPNLQNNRPVADVTSPPCQLGSLNSASINSRYSQKSVKLVF